jgi:hypothetical protein
MRVIIGAVLIALAIDVAAVSVAAPEQAARLVLSPRIGPAQPSKYKGIIDSEKFRNPKLVVGADGVRVIAKGRAPDEAVVSVGRLNEVLRNLPVAAWPYGRVVWASDTGLRRGDLSDTGAIRDNHLAVDAVLNELRVTVEWLPSA